MRKALLAATALCALTASPARAEVFDTAAITALMERTIEGFWQNTNYQKATIHADTQRTDASNKSMGIFFRNLFRKAPIRDEHIVTPAACEAADNGQSIAVASGQSWIVQATLARVTDERREGKPGYSAFVGAGNIAADRNGLHNNRYCSELEAREGVCRPAERPNGDVRSTSLTGVLSYGEQPENLNAAVDFAVNVVQPVPVPALRGDQIKAMHNQDGMSWLRRYQANMSLAQDVLHRYAARRTPSVVLTDAQRAQQRAQGQIVTERGSWLQAAELEVNRRMAGRAWREALWRMPPASVEREKAEIMALQAHLQLEQLRVSEDAANTGAAILAALTERETGRAEHAFRMLGVFPIGQVR